MKKRSIVLLLALCLTFSLAACSAGGGGERSPQPQGSSQPQEPLSAENTETPPQSSAPEEEENQPTETVPESEPAPTLSTTLEEQLLYDDNGIVIRATGIALDEMGSYESITLALENDTAEEVEFISGVGAEICVNGYMISDAMGGIWETVPAGETVDAEFTFFLPQLERCGIEEIGEVAFYMTTSVGDPGILTVRTSAADSYERLCDTSGQTVYEDEQYKVVYQSAYRSAVYDGLTFYLENNTDDTRSFYGRLIINGGDETASGLIELYPHTAALLDVDFFSIGMDDVESVSVESFTIELPGERDMLITPEVALNLNE